MPLPKSLITITPFSKLLALLLFITFPIAGFFAGMEYQKSLGDHERNVITGNTIKSFDECVAAGNPVMESYPRQCMTDDGAHFVEEIQTVPNPSASPTPNISSEIPPEEQVACTLDAKLCPDGSYVGRFPPNCEFAACPVE